MSQFHFKITNAIYKNFQKHSTIFSIKLKLFFLVNHLQINKNLIQTHKKTDQERYLLYPWHVVERTEKKTEQKERERDDTVCVCLCVCFGRGRKLEGGVDREQRVFVLGVLSLTDDKNADINLFKSTMFHHYKRTGMEMHHFLRLKKLRC